MSCQLKRIGKEVGYRTKGTSERCKRYRYRYDRYRDSLGSQLRANDVRAIYNAPIVKRPEMQTRRQERQQLLREGQ